MNRDKIKDNILYYLSWKIPKNKCIRLDQLSRIFNMSPRDCYEVLEDLSNDGKVILINRLFRRITTTFVKRV